MSISTARYPFDIELLEKGDFIPPEEIETLTGKARGTDAYRLALMGVTDQVRRGLRDIGRTFTVCSRKEGIAILTDEEAVVYGAQKFARGLRSMGAAHRDMLGVDRSQLTEDSRRAHDRHVEVQGKVVGAARKAHRLALRPHRRGTPLLKEPLS